MIPPEHPRASSRQLAHGPRSYASLRTYVYRNHTAARGDGYPRGVSDKEKPPIPKPFTAGGLIREVSYLHRDEAEALALRAKKERVTKAEIIRRALRLYLGIED